MEDLGFASTSDSSKKARSKSKLVVSFDEKKRRHFLTGFHKRKLQRQAVGRKMIKKQHQQKLNENRRMRREYIDRLRTEGRADSASSDVSDPLNIG